MSELQFYSEFGLPRPHSDGSKTAEGKYSAKKKHISKHVGEDGTDKDNKAAFLCLIIAARLQTFFCDVYNALDTFSPKSRLLRAC